MLGKSSSQYKAWTEHAKYLKQMPYDCQIVNTGSTPSYKAFDYRLWDVVGFNLGFQPQPLYYDFETLKKYSDHVAKDAKILIGVEEFKLFIDAYNNEATDHKYYLWLDGEQIRTYKKSTEWLMHHAPAVLHPNLVLRDVKHSIKRILGKEEVVSEVKMPSSEESDAQWAQRWVHSWNREFGWENGQQIRKEQAETIAINENRLSTMVDYCIAHSWKPYLVVPPFSSNLTRLLSEEVLKQGIWIPLERVSREKNIPFLNFYHDERFADYRLYANALTFNENGRNLFNKIIQEKIGIEEVQGVGEQQGIGK